MGKENLRNLGVREEGDAHELDERDEGGVRVMQVLAEKAGGTRGHIVRAGLAFLLLAATTLAATVKAKFAKADDLDEEALAAFMQGGAGSEQTLTAEELDALTADITTINPWQDFVCEDMGLTDYVAIGDIEIRGDDLYLGAMKSGDTKGEVYKNGTKVIFKYSNGSTVIHDLGTMAIDPDTGMYYLDINGGPSGNAITEFEADGTSGDSIPETVGFGEHVLSIYGTKLYILNAINTFGGYYDMTDWTWHDLVLQDQDGFEITDVCLGFDQLDDDVAVGSFRREFTGEDYLLEFNVNTPDAIWRAVGDISDIAQGTPTGFILNPFGDATEGYFADGENAYHCTTPCVPDTCADLAVDCGVWDDGCGGEVNCGGDEVCDNGLYCDGVETCNDGTGFCEDGADVICSNGLFCDGVEWCNETTDQCADGTDPCDTGTETCNEVSDMCEHIGDDDDTTDDDTTDDDTTDDDTTDDDTTDDDTTDDDTTDDDTTDDDTTDDDTTDDDTTDDDTTDDDTTDDDTTDDDTTDDDTTDDDTTDDDTTDDENSKGDGDDDDDGGCGCS